MDLRPFESEGCRRQIRLQDPHAPVHQLDVMLGGLTCSSLPSFAQPVAQFRWRHFYCGIAASVDKDTMFQGSPFF